MKPSRSLSGAVSVGVLLAFVGPVAADESPPRPPGGTLGLIRDLRLTVLARRELQHDRVLAPLNLGVRVRDGVAEVWGSVPSDEVARQAVAKLETVRGVLDVRPSFIREPRPRPQAFLTAKPALPSPPVAVADRGRPAQATAALVAAPATAGRGTALLPPRPPPGGEALGAAVERVRHGEARFAAVPLRVEGSVIILRRGETADDDVTDLARLLRQLPGAGEVRLVDE